MSNDICCDFEFKNVSNKNKRLTTVIEFPPGSINNILIIQEAICCMIRSNLVKSRVEIDAATIKLYEVMKSGIADDYVNKRVVWNGVSDVVTNSSSKSQCESGTSFTTSEVCKNECTILAYSISKSEESDGSVTTVSRINTLRNSKSCESDNLESADFGQDLFADSPNNSNIKSFSVDKLHKENIYMNRGFLSFNPLTDSSSKNIIERQSTFILDCNNKNVINLICRKKKKSVIPKKKYDQFSYSLSLFKQPNLYHQLNRLSAKKRCRRTRKKTKYESANNSPQVLDRNFCDINRFYSSISDDTSSSEINILLKQAWCHQSNQTCGGRGDMLYNPVVAANCPNPRNSNTDLIILKPTSKIMTIILVSWSNSIYNFLLTICNVTKSCLRIFCVNKYTFNRF